MRNYRVNVNNGSFVEETNALSGNFYTSDWRQATKEEVQNFENARSERALNDLRAETTIRIRNVRESLEFVEYGNAEYSVNDRAITKLNGAIAELERSEQNNIFWIKRGNKPYIQRRVNATLTDLKAISRLAFDRIGRLVHNEDRLNDDLATMTRQQIENLDIEVELLRNLGR